MSHFTCLVLGENVEGQLEPFYELECSFNQKDIQKDPRAQFIKEFETKELIEEWEKIKQTRPDLKYDTPEECASDYFGYTKEGEDWGRWTNPNSKWDWYTIGGRWTGFFKPKAEKD